MGDFNTIFDFDKRINGNLVTFQEVRYGKECIQSLIDICESGIIFHIEKEW